MNSHEYAKKLRELAEFLDSKPEFEMPFKEAEYEREVCLFVSLLLGRQGCISWSCQGSRFRPQGMEIGRT